MIATAHPPSHFTRAQDLLRQGLSSRDRIRRFIAARPATVAPCSCMRCTLCLVIAHRQPRPTPQPHALHSPLARMHAALQTHARSHTHAIRTHDRSRSHPARVRRSCVRPSACASRLSPPSRTSRISSRHQSCSWRASSRNRSLPWDGGLACARRFLRLQLRRPHLHFPTPRAGNSPHRDRHRDAR